MCSPPLVVHSPSMSSRPRAPGADPIISAYEVLARKDRIVSIRHPLYQPSVYERRPSVAAVVVRAERVAERARRRGKEGRREGSRGTLGEERDAGLESEREPRKRRRVKIRRRAEDANA